jgi:hypothetical protein
LRLALRPQPDPVRGCQSASTASTETGWVAASLGFESLIQSCRDQPVYVYRRFPDSHSVLGKDMSQLSTIDKLDRVPVRSAGCADSSAREVPSGDGDSVVSRRSAAAKLGDNARTELPATRLACTASRTAGQAGLCQGAGDVRASAAEGARGGSSGDFGVFAPGGTKVTCRVPRTATAADRANDQTDLVRPAR